MAAKSTAAILQRKMTLARAALAGRTSASSTSLSASFGLPVADIRRILSSMGVHDDG